MYGIGRWWGVAALVMAVSRPSSAQPQAPLPPLQNGHSSTLEAVSYSPDGRFLATADTSTTRVWDAKSGRLLRVFRGGGALAWGSGSVLSVSASPQGYGPAGIRIWDVSTGKLQRFLRQGWAGIAFSADGKRMACGWGNQGFAVLDVPTAKVLRVFEVSYWPGYLLPILSPDGTLVGAANSTAHVYGSDRKEQVFLEVRRVSDGDLVRAFKSSRSLRSLAFSPDGTQIALGQEENLLSLWNFRTDSRRVLLAGTSGSGAIWPIYGVQFSPDGKRLYSTSDDGNTKFWNAQSGALEKSVPNAGDNFLLSVSPDEQRMVGRVGRIVDQSGNLIFSLPPAVPRLGTARFSDDGRLLAMSAGQSVQVWNLATWKQVMNKPLTGEINDVRFGPQGTLVATLTRTEEEERNGERWAWNLSARQLQNVQPLRAAPPFVAPTANWKTDFQLYSYTKTVTVTNAHTGKKRTLNVGDSIQGFALGAVNAGASVSGNGQLSIWNLMTGTKRTIQSISPAYIKSLAFSSDEKWLAVGDQKGGVVIWHLAQTPQQKSVRFVLGAHDDAVSSLAWSKNGRALVSLALDGTIKQWNTATRALQATIELANGQTQLGYRIVRPGRVENHLLQVSTP